MKQHRFLALALGTTLLAWRAAGADILLQHAHLYDGTGAAARAVDVRIHGDRIAAVAAHAGARPG